MNAGQSISARSLDRVFLRGLAWTAGGKWATQVVTWASVLILARLLTPSEFGLVGMAGLYLVITGALAEFGLAGAVMQMRELDRGALSQLNTVGLLFCTAAFGFCVLTSPLVAWFFKSQELVLLVAVNSIAVLITGFQLVPTGMLRRNMDYRRLATAEAVDAILRAILTVSFALLGWSYWSIVIGGLTAKAIAAALVYRWQPVPFAIPRWQTVKAPLSFGAHLTVGQFASTLSSQSDGIVVGRMLGDTLLGSYQMAMTLAKAPAQKVTELVFRVTGPLFANIQNDRVLMRRYYLILLEVLLLTIAPLTLGLSAVAPEAVRFLLGSRWDAAIEPVRWLTLYGGLQTLTSLTGQVLVTLRRTRFTMNMSIALFVLLPISFVFAARWGSGGVALCWLVLAPIALVPYVTVTARDIKLSLQDLAGIALPSAVASIVMVTGLALLRIWVDPMRLSPLPILTILVPAGAVLYLATIWLGFRSRLERYTRFVNELRAERSRRTK